MALVPFYCTPRTLDDVLDEIRQVIFFHLIDPKNRREEDTILLSQVPQPQFNWLVVGNKLRYATALTYPTLVGEWANPQLELGEQPSLIALAKHISQYFVGPTKVISGLDENGRLGVNTVFKIYEDRINPDNERCRLYVGVSQLGRAQCITLHLAILRRETRLELRPITHYMKKPISS